MTQRWFSISKHAETLRTGPDDGDNVVPIPQRSQTLDAMEAELRDLEGQLVDAGAGADRAAMHYNSCRARYIAHRERMAERLKDCGMLVTYPYNPPVCERYGAAPPDQDPTR